jgi:hypothetical protein
MNTKKTSKLILLMYSTYHLRRIQEDILKTINDEDTFMINNFFDKAGETYLEKVKHI